MNCNDKKNKSEASQEKKEKMDVLGSLGYGGQELVFLSNEEYAYLSGNSVNLVDATKGPRDCVWCDNDMGHLVSHVDSRRVILVPATTAKDLVVLDGDNLHDTKNIVHMKNITNGIIINVVFSRTGDRIYGLSNELDPCLIVWDGETYGVIGRLPLPCPFTKCIVNPLDNNKLILIGNSGVYVVTISELLNQNEEYKLPIKIEHFNLSTVNITTNMLSPRASDDDAINTKKIYNSIVTCALWTHSNTVVVGNKLGHLLVVDPYKNTVEYITKLPSKRDKISIPTNFALTINSLIIGTTSGHVYWYSSDIALGYSSDPNPVQASNVYENITALTIDPGYDKIYVGTAGGTIDVFRASVIEKEVKVEDDDLGGNGDGGAGKHAEITTQVTPISSKKYQNASVICVTSFTCKTSSSSASIYVTGSDNGVVNFWKQPLCEPEAITAGVNRIRKSNPSNLQLLSSINTNSEHETASNTVVLTMEVLCSNNLSEVNLFVGYANGHVEIWDVVISDSDEEEEYNSKNNDDELPIKITVHTVASFYMSPNGVSMLFACQGRNLVAVGSHNDRYMYVLQKLDVNTFAVVMYLTLQDDADTPSAGCWCNNKLFIGSKNGNVYVIAVEDKLRGGYTVFDDSVMVPSKVLKVAATSIHTLTATSAGHILASSFDATSLTRIDVTSDVWTSPDSTSEAKTYNTIAITECSTESYCGDHDNYTISTAVSSDHQFFATGSVDGTVYIWNVASNSLITKNHLHKDSVIGLVFSQDSSLLLSCSIDGSIFVLGVTRPHGATRHKSVPSDETYSPGITYINDGTTWLEQRNYQYKITLEKRYEIKKTSILTTVGDITSRLNSMIRRNTEKDELEKMERSEFVVDVTSRDGILGERKQNIEKLKNAYDDAVLCNELIAARLRNNFWDTMEAKSTILLPLTIKDESIHVYTVASIPVRKLTDDERGVLDKIKLMRAIEVRSQRASDLGSVTKLGCGQYRIGWKTAVHGCPGSITWIHNEGERWPCANFITILTDLEKIDEKNEKKDVVTDAAAVAEEDEDGSVGSHDAVNEVDDKDIFNLLYAPQGVRTATQKKIQIELLKEVVRVVARKFNEVFEKLRMEKEDVIASVDSRNVRLTAIMEELKISESLTSFKLSSIEKKGNEINVDSSIIRSNRYETEAELAARLADEERKVLIPDYSLTHCYSLTHTAPRCRQQQRRRERARIARHDEWNP
jgi:WD40 repeat protein